MIFTENERLNYERAKKTYAETQERIRKLPEKDKRLLEQLEKVDIGRYDVPCSTVLMIAEVYRNNAINAFSSIFRLGFLKGTRKTLKELKQEGKNGKKY